MLRLIRIVKLYKSAIITKNQKEKLKSLEITKTKLLEKKKTMMFDRSNSLKSCSPEKKTQKWYMSPSASPKRFSPKRSNKGINNGFQLKIKKGVEVVSIITPQQERISVAYSNDGNRYFADNTQKIDEIELLNQIEEEIHLKESKVGKKLGGLTIKRIIILVLLLIMVIPLMQAAYWNDPTQCHELGIKVLLNMIQNNVTNSEISRYCQVLIETCTKSNSIYPLIYLSTPLTDINCTYSTMDPSLLRGSEKMEAALDYLPNNIVAVLDYRYNSIYNGVIDILRNIFICVVLTIASLLITRDANELVILPIERLIQKVNKLAENPLSIKDQRLLVDQDSDKKELVVIENSIIKIATLLALGYGEAGAEIIGAQMAKNGQMDYALKGKKLYGIFGFCDIRNFTDATEVLQQDVMLFVNNIAEIVHSIVDRYGGSANKNIGDAFLLVWKFNENVGYFLEEEEQQLIPKTNKRVNDFCDLALISFSKIIAKINRAPKILNYRTDPRLCDRIKGYKVKMVFILLYFSI